MSRFWGVLCLWLVSSCIWAGEAVVSSTTGSIWLGGQTSYWVDTTGKASLQEVMALEPNAWSPNREGGSFGYTDETYWFHFGVKNPEHKAQSLILEIGYPVLDYAKVFLVQDGQVVSSYNLGDKQSFFERPIHHRNFLVPIELPAAGDFDVYLQVQTTSSMQVPLILWQHLAFMAAEQSSLLFQGAYYGVVMVMILYSLLLYVVVHERAFLYYVGYTTFLPLFFTCLHGLAFQYLWPDATWWNDQAIIFFLAGTLFFGSLFTMRFLSIYRHNHPVAHGVNMGLVAVTALFMLSAFFVPYVVTIRYIIHLAIICCTSMLVMGCMRWIKGDVAARYYTAAWGFVLFGGIILALSKFTVLPRNLLTENAAQVGSALGVLLLSVALADRLNKEKRAAFEAQREVLAQERKVRLAQEETLAIQREANQMLEARVQERTQELERLNHQLLELSATDALTGLKNRRYFEQSFEAAHVRAFRLKSPLSVLVLDIDHFKSLNDTYGHTVGDDCLRSIARTLRESLARTQDLVARFGGEEFVVLLPDTDRSGAIRVAEKIRLAVEQTEFMVAEQKLAVTVSIGVATQIPAGPDQQHELFRKADEALYEAKAAGRNRVCCHQDSDGDFQAKPLLA